MPGPDSAKRSPPAARATCSSLPNSTASHAPFPTPATSSRTHHRQVKLNLGGSVHDPEDPVGRLLLNVLAMVAEFESDLIRMRTREGLAVARAAGKLRGRKPKITRNQEAHLVGLYRAGDKNPAELAELFNIGRSTVYRAIERAGGRAAPESGVDVAGQT